MITINIRQHQYVTAQTVANMLSDEAVTKHLRAQFRDIIEQESKYIDKRVASTMKRLLRKNQWWKNITGALYSGIKVKTDVRMERRKGLRRIIIHYDIYFAIKESLGSSQSIANYIVSTYGKHLDEQVQERLRRKLADIKHKGYNYGEDILFNPVEEWSFASVAGIVRGRIVDISSGGSAYWVRAFEHMRDHAMDEIEKRSADIVERALDSIIEKAKVNIIERAHLLELKRTAETINTFTIAGDISDFSDIANAIDWENESYLESPDEEW